MMAKQLPSDRTFKTEAALLKAVTDWLAPQRRDGIAYVRICDMYTKGISDLLICVKGQLVLAELKDDTGKPTPHQLQFIERMKEAGAIGGVCRTVKEVADYVEEAKRIVEGREENAKNRPCIRANRKQLK